MSGTAEVMHITKPMLKLMFRVLPDNPQTNADDLNALALAGICLRERQPIPAHITQRVEAMWGRASRAANRAASCRLVGPKAP